MAIAAPQFRRLKRDVDMTEGSIIRHLLVFAAPLMLGNLFQQMYNMVDTWVVGNYVSNEAFSAVGSVGPIINVLIGFFLGFSSGVGVVISQFYGARQYDKVQDTVHTAIAVTLLLGVVLSVVGVTMTPFALRMMKTPEEVFPESKAYLTIYFSGLLGLMIYNIGSGILRAVGDSSRPFYFLVVSAIVNTVLDLVFVLVLHMGVEGVALATIIAQGVSATLVLITLTRSDICIKLSWQKLKVHRDMLFKILKVGLPASLQMAITSFSNVFVQSYINYFGKDCMSGWTAYSKTDALLFLPMQSIALASTTFVGQNLGKNNVVRAKKGVNTALMLAMSITAVGMIPVMIFAPYVVAFFNNEPGVIEYGTMFLRNITPFYIVCAVNQVCSASLRGAGNSRTPTIIMLCTFVGLRQVYMYIMSTFIVNEALPVIMGYPVGWVACSICIYTYYRLVKLEKSRLVDDKKKQSAEESE